MSLTGTMTIRLPIETINRLADLARSTDRSKSYLATKAIEEFVTSQEWQIKAIEDAVQEADAPNAVFHDHTAVVARMKKKISAARKGKQR
ncbi:MAG: CopG family transcriptional regulator [Candidatus Riflebacteria bacterium]|nr:CopG family transcriptional regulator [Candidatus Riflebacteria bacterium]